MATEGGIKLYPKGMRTYGEEGTEGRYSVDRENLRRKGPDRTCNVWGTERAGVAGAGKQWGE